MILIDDQDAEVLQHILRTGEFDDAKVWEERGRIRIEHPNHSQELDLVDRLLESGVPADWQKSS